MILLLIALPRPHAASGAPAASGAEASPDRAALASAKEAFETAQVAFVRGDYLDAAEKFQAAYDRKAFPAFLFNVAVSYEKAKQLEKAKSFFEKYLESDPNANDAAQVKLRLEVIGRMLGGAPTGATGAPPPAVGSALTVTADGGVPPQPAGGSSLAGAGSPDGGATSASPLAASPLVLTDIQTKGLVVIDSKPQGATIYLNDKRSGPFAKTPWEGSLESKPVRLILEAKGWKPEERAINPRPDKLIDVYIALSEEHYLGWIEVVSNVPGADVYLDRKDIGTVGRTPFSGHLKPGPHTIYVEKLGWDPARQVVDVKPGTAMQVPITLNPAQKGWVSVSGRGISGGRLFVDDKLACATPCRAEMVPGRHRIRVERAGAENYASDLDVARGVETSIDVQLSPRPPRTRAISTGIVALVLVGSGAYVGHLSQQTKDDINRDIKNGLFVDNGDSRFTRGKLEAIGADVLFGLGGIVAIAALWSVFEHGPDSTGIVDHKTISFIPEVAPMFGVASGGGLVMSGRF